MQTAILVCKLNLVGLRLILAQVLLPIGALEVIRMTWTLVVLSPVAQVVPLVLPKEIGTIVTTHLSMYYTYAKLALTRTKLDKQPAKFVQLVHLVLLVNQVVHLLVQKVPIRMEQQLVFLVK